jgi:hypothetical protein
VLPVETESNAARARFSAINELLSREAGYSVAKKCLEVQAAAERRDPALRTETSVTLSDDAWSWYVGAIGERVVGEILRALGPEWMVRHAVPIGSGTKDIDHLVIGPTGVYAINTKHHIGASIWIGDHVLRVNNANTPHIAAARRDADDVSVRLARHADFGVHVVPVVALVGQSTITDGRKGPRSHPAVVDSRRLVDWMLRQTASHSSTELELIRLAAEEPSTWHSDPTAARTSRVMQRFDRLVGEVGAAPKPQRRTPEQRPGFGREERAVRTSPRPPVRTTAPRRLPRGPGKREIARRARRNEAIMKLVVLAVAAMTAPAWLPGLIASFTSALTSAMLGE